MTSCPIVWIVIGVSGSGKTTVGRAFAAVRECDFLEGDRRHPAANIQKMQAQTPLTDGNREQWLDAIVSDIRRALDCGYETVITCSALKRQYRQRLQVDDRVQFIYLDVSEEELRRRLQVRTNHYIQVSMLASQLAVFEPVELQEDVMVVNGMSDVATIVQEILSQSRERFGQFDRPWWDR